MLKRVTTFISRTSPLLLQGATTPSNLAHPALQPLKRSIFIAPSPSIKPSTLISRLAPSILFPTAFSKPVIPVHHQCRTAYVGLRPRKMKYQKAFKGHFKARPHSLRATTLTIGNYGLRVTEGGRLKDKQLDQLRTIVRRALKEEKGAKFYFRVFTARPVSKKAAETRMGKGKGAVEYFASWVSRGRIVFEVKSTRRELALKALRIAAEALPLRTTVIELGEEGFQTAPRCLPFFIKKKLDAVEFENHLVKRMEMETAKGLRGPITDVVAGTNSI